MIAAVLAPLAVIGIVVVLDLAGVAFASTFLNDPLDVGPRPFWTGSVSSLRVLTWTAGAVVALFTAAVLRMRPERSSESAFLAELGLWSLYLTLDDLFLLHDQALSVYVGIREPVVYALYAAATLALVVRNRRLAREATWLPPLVAALALLAFSVALDVGFATISRPVTAIDEAAKLVATVLISLYLIGTAYAWLGAPALVAADRHEA